MPNLERLSHLADILAKVPKKNFDLGKWTDGQDVDTVINTESIENTCGTSACAVGWACYDSQFRSEGLGFYTQASLLKSWFTLSPMYEDWIGWKAVRAFFELTSFESNFLFNEGMYTEQEWWLENPTEGVTPEQVITRIKIILDNPYGDDAEYLNKAEQLESQYYEY